ncbi:hypothetical protein CEXT_504281 [Caerostris extrusa]|uniref:Uncharacterized protein n=1 Tax=Caerostris extrusa TaxID=172846 RepID=A0AAV4SD73_CAEEX|nr:hypothetical protein CEXT_504281 [Caerostris extrusa]
MPPIMVEYSDSLKGLIAEISKNSVMKADNAPLLLSYSEMSSSEVTRPAGESVGVVTEMGKIPLGGKDNGQTVIHFTRDNVEAGSQSLRSLLKFQFFIMRG